MPSTIEVTQIFKTNPGFVARDIAGELVLIPVQKELRDVNCIYSMNPVGKAIWDTLDGKTSLSDIKHQILGQYAIDEETLEKDLLTISEQLLEIKAILPV